MRRHETSTEKFLRNSWYRVLRIKGYSLSQAARMRDWTHNKLTMILNNEARPIV